MSNGPYRACHTSQEERDKPYLYGIEGPGAPGYYGWIGWPKQYFADMDTAERVAAMMNLAFREGQKARSRQIKELLE